MRIVCATNMPFAEEAFSTLGEVTVLEGRTITARDIKDAEILAIRSTTRVDRSLLEGSRVRFVGTATIGTDHMDLAYFERAGLAWCYAPGCNANSVSEYVVAALLCLGQRHGLRLEGKTMGVVGVGNVGSRVVQKARALGMRALLNDPPRERQERGGRQSEIKEPGTEFSGRLEGGPFVPLDEVLKEADIITLHVPLTEAGPDATLHMADAVFFRSARRGVIFLDAARGAVVDSDALLTAMDQGLVGHAVLDTWEHEPQFRRDALSRVDIGTPHIAGHSFEGKVIGTVMVYQAACRFLGVNPAWSPGVLMPSSPVRRSNADGLGRSDEEVLWEVVRQVYDITADDRRMRAANAADDVVRGEAFDRLRREYPDRREFPCTEVTLRNASCGLAFKLERLGFRVRRVTG
jgi:erythronate-4-phosphate dehydrogenase